MLAQLGNDLRGGALLLEGLEVSNMCIILLLVDARGKLELNKLAA